MKNLSLENIASSITWQEFEKLVSEILKENGFMVRKSFRFKTDRRYEIDLVAARDDLVLCIDCKQWGQGRQKKSGLLKAVRNQEERLEEFVKVLGAGKSIERELSIKHSSATFQSLIVTLLKEDVTKENKTFVVPLFILNSFILDIEKYL